MIVKCIKEKEKEIKMNTLVEHQLGFFAVQARAQDIKRNTVFKRHLGEVAKYIYILYICIYVMVWK